MGEVQIRFSPEMAHAALEGRKCCTSRRDLKGLPGDLFDIDGSRFRILHVSRERVNDIVLQFSRLEGFHLSTTCKETLNALYPDLDGRDYLYVHFFARCPE